MIGSPEIRSIRRRILLPALIGVLFCLLGNIRADSVVKSSTGTDLADGASWGGTAPGSSDTASWNSNSLGSGLVLYDYVIWNGISVSNALSDIDVSGWGTMQVNAGGIDMSASTVNLTIGNYIILGANQTWNVNAGQTFNFSGEFGYGLDLTKEGAGTLVFSGNNPNTGVTYVNGGTVVISGQLHATEGYAHIPALTINSGGTVVVSDGNAGGFLGQCNFDPQYNTINGGTLAFNTASGNSEAIDRSFTIGTNGATISVLNSNATLTFDHFSDPMQFSVPGPATFTLAGDGNGVMNKNIGGPGGVVKTGNGTWSLNMQNTYSGPTVVNNGTLLVNGSTGVGNVSVGGGAMFGGIGYVQGNVYFAPGAQAQFTPGSVFSASGSMTLNENTVHLELTNGVAPGTYPLASYFVAGSSGSFAGIPVIDTGSLADGCSANVETVDGHVNLVVNPPAGAHLAILCVNGGSNVTAGVGFSVLVEAEDVDGNPLAMDTDTNVVLSLISGNGILAGNLYATIPAGSSSVVVSNATYTLVESGVALAVQNNGGNLLSGESDPFTVIPGQPSIITIASGNNWSANTGKPLPGPFVVNVTDAGGNPISGAGVVFAVTGVPAGAIGQSLSYKNTTTGSNGTASSTLTLGTKIGTYTVTASLADMSGSFVTFTATAQVGGWKQVWSDEFNYNGLPDSTKWVYESGFVRNGESQYYTTNRPQNAWVTNGLLTITAIQEEYTPPGATSPVGNYTSASITTQNLESWRYGRIEMRAKLPFGASGIWPAFWTVGTNVTTVNWPACGESDIMEYLGRDLYTVRANNYFGTTPEDVTAERGGISPVQPFNDFHIYAMEWSSNRIDYYFDNTNYFSFNVDDAGTGPDNPFRQPHYILVNFALGGSYGGPIDNSFLPQQYQIDYVRVYEKIPTWTGNGSDSLWDTEDNWTNSLPPTNGDKVIFSGIAPSNSIMDASWTLNGLDFDQTSGSYSIVATNGAILTLASGGIINYGPGQQTLNIPIVLGSTQTIETDSNAVTIGGPISGGRFGLNKTGASVLNLLGSNSYAGGTSISAGTLALGQGGSLNPGSPITIAAGATFDVSAMGDYVFPPGSTIYASGKGMPGSPSAATINCGADSLVIMETNPVSLFFDGANPPLVVSQGVLSLSSNFFSVTVAGSGLLGPGTYPLIVQATGNIVSAGGFPPAGGSAIGPGETGTIVVQGNTVSLVVSLNTTFENLTASQSITYGATNLALGGTLVAQGGTFAPMGDMVNVTIGGTTQTATINDYTGDFSINFNPSGLQAGAVPYPVTYAYAGNSSLELGAANDQSTALTVSPAPLVITANDAVKIYGQTLTFAGTEFIPAGLLGGDTVTNVTLTCAGAGPSAAVTNYPIVPSAAMGSGLSNYNITFVNGTLTVNAAPNPVAQGITVGIGTAQITFSGVGGVTYVTQYTTNFPGVWTPISTNTPGDDGIWTVNDTNAVEGSKFYRTVIP